MNAKADKAPSAPPSEAPAPPAGEAVAGAAQVKGGMSLPFDPWRLVAALLRRWLLIPGVGLAVAALGGVAGYHKFTAEYKAGAQLMRQESGATFRASESGESFKPRQLSVPTLVSFVKSPAVLQRVAEQARIPARTIAGGFTITPERNTDLINLSFNSTRSAQTAVRVLNAYGNEIVRLTREMQAQEATELNRLLKRQLAKTEDDLHAVNKELLDFSRQAGLINADKEIDAYLRSLGDLDLRFETMRIDYETLDLKINALERELAANNPLSERLQSAREQLRELLQKYTEANPFVEEQKATISDLEARMKVAGTNAIAPPRQGESGLATSFYTELLNLKTQKEVTAAQIEKLKSVRAGVEDKLRGLPEKGMQLARIRAREQLLEAAQSLLASRQHEAQLYEENALGYYRFFESKLDEVEVAGRSKKLLLLTAAGGMLGLGLVVGLVCLVESLDDRIKTAADLKRISKLPLLGRLPALGALDAVAQSNWAFRTWLALQAKLTAGPHHEIVCGFVSATSREGCSTWVDLLARAAGQRDEKVLAVMNHAPLNGSAMPLGEALVSPASLCCAPGHPQWLITPVGWRWDAARRRQWQSALAVWSQAAGLVVLIELTAADQPETLMLAEQLPQLIWLASSGVARGRESSERLQTFQNAGCHFAGTVLNREAKLFPWL
ncbi:MAG: hypothetical protein WCQ21_13535 [Verrucomicrobiota bacterium]